MSKIIVNPKDESLRDIFGNGKKYLVPKFQRDYSWENEHWRDLWEDIELINSEEEEHHYMGYLVLEETGERLYKVIDGQQRLTTFSLLILAAIKRLKKINEEKRADSLFKNFIGSENLIYLTVDKKLQLNRNNDFYYIQAVEGNKIPRRNVKETVRLMRESIDFFSEKFAAISEGEKISGLVEKMVNRMFFTTLYIGEELNAYKIFETLNARGVKLSSADLLKNYLFSRMDDRGDTPDNIVDEWDEKWEKIGANIAGKSYPEYILAHWNSHHKLVRQNQLFRAIKQEIQQKEQSANYLNQLVADCDLYGALLSENSEFWKDYKINQQLAKIKKNVSFLRLFGIRQPISLLLAGYLNFEQDFHSILEWVCVLSLRYNIICREHTGEQENLYNHICVEITKGCKIDDIKKKLLTLYPSDEKFLEEFSEKVMPTKHSNKKARYLLARLEEFESNNTIDEADLTVEHMLPLNPEEQWIDCFGNDWGQYNQRLGNMALLPSKENLAQELFEQKKEILLKSQYSINRNIENNSEWSIAEINARQKKLAKIAVKTWRID